MNLNEAYEALNLCPPSTPDEVKTAYKKLVFELHPDRNPSPEAAEKLKTINEAYACIKDPPKPKPNSPFRRSGLTDDDFGTGINFEEVFNFGGFRTNTPRRTPPPPIQLAASISFIQSITGLEYTLNYRRLFKCEICQGAGHTKPKNDCQDCKGQGRVTVQQGNMTISTTCSKCRGVNMKSDPCPSCQGRNGNEVPISLQVKIPAGVFNQVLRVQHAGHYMQSDMFGDHYGEVHVQVSVEPHHTLSLKGSDVICPLNLTLLEALEGCQKTVPTIQGEETITVPSNSRHKEEVILEGLGVKEQKGVERVVFSVVYPEDKRKQLIWMLRG